MCTSRELRRFMVSPTQDLSMRKPLKCYMMNRPGKKYTSRTVSQPLSQNFNYLYICLEYLRWNNTLTIIFFWLTFSACLIYILLILNQVPGYYTLCVIIYISKIPNQNLLAYINGSTPLFISLWYYVSWKINCISSINWIILHQSFVNKKLTLNKIENILHSMIQNAKVIHACVLIPIQIFCWNHLYFRRSMCLRFADLERKLGEIDRARAIYAHASQIADPRVSEIHSDLIILNWMAKLSDTLLHFYKLL